MHASLEPKLLILDLDETLVFSSTEPLARPADFRVGPYFVYRRPFLDSFLASSFTWFQVAVWTSSSPLYAAGVVRQIFPEPDRLSFVWASDRCTLVRDLETAEECARKNLAKVRRRGYRLEAVIVVDDSPEKLCQSYGNLVRVKPFVGDEADDELPRLAAFLESLRTVPNVRAIEKRHWRSRRDVGETVM